MDRTALFFIFVVNPFAAFAGLFFSHMYALSLSSIKAKVGGKVAECFFYLSMLRRLHVNYIGFYAVINGVSDRSMKALSQFIFPCAEFSV